MTPNKSIIFALLALMATLGVGQAERIRYDNYRLYRARAENEDQLRLLKQLSRSSDSIIFLDGVNIVGSSVKMVVAPHKVPDLLELLDKAGIEYRLKTKDFQKTLEDVNEKVAIKGRSVENYNWAQYYELDDTYRWLRSLAKTYPHIVTLIDGGKSYEGRMILGVKISKNRSEKPGIFVEAGIHGREWIAPAAATYLINQLLISEVDSIKQFARNYNWFIFPHLNPDGYVYSHTTDRLWRKTRKPYGTTFGADPNRNWNYHWSRTDVEATEEDYPGPSAFSEIETLSVSNYIESIKDKIQLYIALHAHAQMLLYPYGHGNKLPHNARDLEQVCNVSVAAISRRYNTKYTGGRTYRVMYPAAGISIDWVHGALGIPMAFTFELRPQDDDETIGFELPAEQIIPASEELLDSIVAMVAEVRKLGYFDAINNLKSN